MSFILCKDGATKPALLSESFKLGGALSQEGTLIVICRSTRNCHNTISALVDGITCNGGMAIYLGICSTSMLSHFVRQFGADYGVILFDNGSCLILDNYGLPICNHYQAQIVNKLCLHKLYYNGAMQKQMLFPNADKQYANALLDYTQAKLFKLKITIVACPVTIKLCRKVFANSGAIIHNANSTQINSKKMSDLSTNLESLQTTSNLTIYLYGNSIYVESNGIIVQDCKLFYVFCKYLQEEKRLNNNAVVGNVDIQTQQALCNLGITVFSANSQIYKTMCINKASFGYCGQGEFIFADFSPYSDAVLMALMIAKIEQNKGGVFAYM